MADTLGSLYRKELKDLKIKNIIKKHNNKIKVFSGYYYLKNKKNRLISYLRVYIEFLSEF